MVSQKKSCPGSLSTGRLRRSSRSVAGKARGVSVGRGSRLRCSSAVAIVYDSMKGLRNASFFGREDEPRIGTTMSVLKASSLGAAGFNVVANANMPIELAPILELAQEVAEPEIHNAFGKFGSRIERHALSTRASLCTLHKKQQCGVGLHKMLFA